MSVCLPLGATGDPRGAAAFSEVLPWLVAMAVLACLRAAVIYLVRRTLCRQGPPPSEGFTLQQLRDLHAAGQLNDEEFERAKTSIIGRLADTQRREAQIGPDQPDPDSGSRQGPERPGDALKTDNPNRES